MNPTENLIANIISQLEMRQKIFIDMAQFSSTAPYLKGYNCKQGMALAQYCSLPWLPSNRCTWLLQYKLYNRKTIVAKSNIAKSYI